MANQNFLKGRMDKTAFSIGSLHDESDEKEYWLSQNINKLNVPFCMGVGGSFDIVAGITKRAPLWMQELGLEWFYRFKEEPKRMWKRYLVGNTKFCLLLFKEYFRIRIKKE